MLGILGCPSNSTVSQLDGVAIRSIAFNRSQIWLHKSNRITSIGSFNSDWNLDPLNTPIQSNARRNVLLNKISYSRQSTTECECVKGDDTLLKFKMITSPVTLGGPQFNVNASKEKEHCNHANEITSNWTQVQLLLAASLSQVFFRSELSVSLYRRLPAEASLLLVQVLPGDDLSSTWVRMSWRRWNTTSNWTRCKLFAGSFA
jgi:hypothetical protein